MLTSRIALLAVAAILCSLTLRSARAQQAPSASGVPVHMIVTAETPHGYNPPAITREDVMVREGRDRDAVTGWVPAQGEHAGLELFVLLDDASSASLGSQLGDIRQFINAQPATTRIGVAYMQDGTAEIVQDLTADHNLAAKALRLPLEMPGVNASPYFSLSDLIKRWPTTNFRREVIMVTDGIDRFWGSGPDDPYVDSVMEQAQRAGILVYSIYTPGVGHYARSPWRTWWGQIYLSRLSDETGGEAYYIGFRGAPVSFVPYLDEVTHDLAHQYLLTFVAKPGTKAGLQSVRVTTEVHNAELVGADSVYVRARG